MTLSKNNGIENNSLFNRLLELVYLEIDITKNVDENLLKETIDNILMSNEVFSEISVFEKISLQKKAINRLNGLDILTELLANEEITEIMVNGHNNVFIEKRGNLEKLDYGFESEERLFEVIQKIMSNTNRAVNETNPIVDTRLNDGSRVNIVLFPISLTGATVTIRKFPNEVMSLDKLKEYGSINDEIAEFLDRLVKEKYNIFISGGTSSGKTSMLNALAKCIPKNERVITIEDSAEIRLDSIENYVSLEVRSANMEGKNEISMRELIKTALRMRPNRILVGEVRGAETVEMLQAMNTGHSGSISTGHANSAKDMISRLETMVVMGVDIPLMAVRKQIQSAIDIIIHLGRDIYGNRRLIEISAIDKESVEEIKLKRIYIYDSGTYKKCIE